MGGAQERRHNSLTDKLPPEVLREVNMLLIQGETTYDDIQAFLAGHGFDISRSAIGRYGKGYFVRYQEMRIMEDQARTLISEAGENGMVLEEAVSKTFTQMILKALLNGEMDSETLLQKVPRLISDFAKLQSSTVARERVKNEYAKKAEKVAADVLTVVKAEGLSDTKAEEIRRKIQGIGD